MAIVFAVHTFAGFSQSKMIVQPGTEIKLAASNYAVLENTDLVNNGLINLNSGYGTFKFSGSNNTNISGTSKPLFNNIELAKTGTAQLILQRDIDTWGTFLFTSGILHLNNNIMDLGKFGSLSNESETSHTMGPTGGYIQWSDVINAPSAMNPGNLGAILSSSQNLGTTTIRRGHVSQTNGAGAGSSILRYFDIIPTNNTSLNATLRFTYLDAELNGLPEPSLEVWKSANLTTWSDLGFDSRNTIANYVEKAGINDFSRWTLSNPLNALPVHFGVFNTNCNGNTVTLTWTTESEMNTGLFEVQRSIDGVNWVGVSTLPATGNSTVSRQYSVTDNASLQNGFYRVAEIDLTGKVNYSTISKVNCGFNAEFKLWPNPTSGSTWLSIGTTTDEKSTLKIIDQKGTVVFHKELSLFSGNNIVDVDMHTLSPGSYLVQIQLHNRLKSIAVIKL